MAFDSSLETPVIWGYEEKMLAAETLGLDLEADSLHRHQERICLVQLTDGEQGVLVDPLEGELDDLVAKLLSREVWLHGADYDMALMKRDWGGLPVKIWDTQIAARLVGCRKFGYANLVQEFFEVELPKGSQKADWGKRPLPERMAQYALNDVKYLIPMAKILQEKLRELGRFEWFEESCQWERERALERPVEKEDPWRIKGSGKLDPRRLQALKTIWQWREEEAAEWNRPSFMVAGNKDLLAWAEAHVQGQRLSLPKSMRGDRRRRLFEALEKSVEVSESEWPAKIRGVRRQRDREREKVVDQLLARRTKVAEELDLEPSVLGSRASFEAHAGDEPSRLMKWQRDVMNLE
jgi:ribonuclease D